MFDITWFTRSIRCHFKHSVDTLITNLHCMSLLTGQADSQQCGVYRGHADGRNSADCLRVRRQGTHTHNSLNTLNFKNSNTHMIYVHCRDGRGIVLVGILMGEELSGWESWWEGNCPGGNKNGEELSGKGIFQIPQQAVMLEFRTNSPTDKTPMLFLTMMDFLSTLSYSEWSFCRLCKKLNQTFCPPFQK